jgi:Leucine-rich repeat (LRR) protein
LILTNNNISKLPPLLGFVKELKQLKVEGNPIKTIKRSLIQTGDSNLMQWLRDKYIRGVDDQIEDWALGIPEQATPIKL